MEPDGLSLWASAVCLLLRLCVSNTHCTQSFRTPPPQKKALAKASPSVPASQTHTHAFTHTPHNSPLTVTTSEEWSACEELVVKAVCVCVGECVCVCAGGRHKLYQSLCPEGLEVMETCVSRVPCSHRMWDSAQGPRRHHSVMLCQCCASKSCLFFVSSFTVRFDHLALA